MKTAVVWLVLLFSLAVPANAMEFSAPEAPESAIAYMPDETENFGEGLLFVMRAALKNIQPSLVEAGKTCVALIAASLLTGILISVTDNTKTVTEMVGAAIVGILLFQPTKSLIQLGTETVQQISQYGKLLLPVMTGSLAAQGAVTKSGALYTATAFFDALLSSAVSDLLIPLVYVYLCVALGYAVCSQAFLKDISTFLKWLMTWGLKTILYLFTGYISITGVVGGATDAAMLKATKLTISGMVPVVGGILSDASEAVLVSAGLMKNSVGIYGLLAVTALWIGPFIQIGVQYLMLKITAGICHMFGVKQMTLLMKAFSDAMGLILAMTGTVCLILLISTICFMRGVGS